MAEQDTIDDSAQQNINVPSENSTIQPENEHHINSEYPSEYFRSDIADPINLAIRKQLSEKTIDLEKRFNKLKRRVAEKGDLISKLGKDLSDYKNSQIRTVEIVSVFVAFLAFVTTEGVFFKQIDSFGAVICFTLVLLGSLLLFLSVSHLITMNVFFPAIEDQLELYTLHHNKKGKNNWFIISIILLSLLVIILGIGVGSAFGVFRKEIKMTGDNVNTQTKQIFIQQGGDKNGR